MSASEDVCVPFEEGYANANYEREESRLLEALVEPKHALVQHLEYSTYEYRQYCMPRYVAYASPLKPDTDQSLATGIGVSIEEATVKALAEMYERALVQQPRVDYTGAADTVPYPIFDMCEPGPLHAQYVQEHALTGNAREASWVTGTKLGDGSCVSVPVSQVFFGTPSPTYRATTSGVAAHQSTEAAIESALLELIERDAVAVTWYARRTPPQLSHSMADLQTQARLRKVRSQMRRRVILCDLTLDSVPVVLCVLVGNSYPYVSCGSAAHWDRQVAIRKALDEAELMVHTTRGTQRHNPPQAHEVHSVEDHALFWSSREHMHDLEWLLQGNVHDPADRALTLSDLIQYFDPVVVQLSEPHDVLSVVRVLSQKLMPLTFGYGAEHYRHARLGLLGFTWGWQYPALPHLLA